MYKTIAQVNKKIFFKKGDLVKVIALTKKTGRICIVVEDGNLDTTIVLEPSGKKSIALTDSLGLIQAFNKKNYNYLSEIISCIKVLEQLHQ